jgi:hypothetical protein
MALHEDPSMQDRTPIMDVFSIDVPMLDVDESELAILSMTSSNHYTSGNYGQSDTCCTCTTT